MQLRLVFVEASLERGQGDTEKPHRLGKRHHHEQADGHALEVVAAPDSNGNRPAAGRDPESVNFTLAECTGAMPSAAGSEHSILDSPDDLKFSSSLTLFDAANAGPLYRDALECFFDGGEDPMTVGIIAE